MIQRWAVKIEYDGKDYNGWQKQNNGISIQQRLEEAASQLSGGFQIPSITAGRTDTGVHAIGQVAHLDFPAELSLSAKKYGMGSTIIYNPTQLVFWQLFKLIYHGMHDFQLSGVAIYTRY